jgi:hypothetical protein
MEKDEWVHGTPNSLIAHVLGTKYNEPGVEPSRADIEGMDSREKGFGDCDDVATVAAAGVLALGMSASYVVGTHDNGAHVWVLAKTPRGEEIHIDPVGHPEHEFGWRLPGDFQTVPIIGIATQGATRAMGTFFGNIDEMEEQGEAPHVCACHPEDRRGPRVLAVPAREARLMEGGIVKDGTPAVDQYGGMYEYDAGTDIWRDVNIGPLGRIGRRKKRRSDRRDRRRGRRATRRARRRRIVKRVSRAVKPIARRVAFRLMQNRQAQKAVGEALMTVGVPRRLTVGVMQAGGSIIKKIGLTGFIKLLKRDRRKAMQLAAIAAKSGLKRAAFSGVESIDRQTYHQNGVEYAGQPVQAIIGIPGSVTFGALDVVDTPEPGHWYRVKRGDTLFGVTSKAFNVKGGSERLRLARMINRSEANRVYVDPTLADNLFKDGRITFKPRFSSNAEEAISGESGNSYALLWIPESEGDEPPEMVPDSPEPTPDVPLPVPEETPKAEVPLPTPEPETEPAPAPAPLPVTPKPTPPVAPKPAPPVEPRPAPKMPDVVEPPVSPEKEYSDGSKDIPCPDWFTRDPNDAGICRPDACPPGMVWRSAAQGGPQPHGGCVFPKVVQPSKPPKVIQPAPQPMPQPAPVPDVPDQMVLPPAVIQPPDVIQPPGASTALGVGSLLLILDVL